MKRLAAVCTRAGVSVELAHKALLRAMPIPNGVWAKEVEVDGTKLVVGQGSADDMFVCFPCPFEGHSDEWKVILPIRSANDLLKQLKGET